MKSLRQRLNYVVFKIIRTEYVLNSASYVYECVCVCESIYSPVVEDFFYEKKV